MKKILFISLILAFFCACEDNDTQPLEALFTSETQTTMAGDTIMFKDMSTGNPVKWNWYFEGGTPATSELFSPEISYKTPGTYSVKLVIGRGNDSATVEKSAYITVEYPNKIKADFEADKILATNVETIMFTDKSTGIPSQWLWEFIPDVGTAVTSTEQNPALTFVPATYTVKLTVSNPKTTETVTKEKYLKIIDVNSAEADFSAVCPYTYNGGKVKFEDKSSGNILYRNWTFEGGDPSTSTEQNPVVTYNTPGKYKVKLIASNDGNASTMEKEGYIVVISGQDLILFYPFEGDSKDIGPNGIHPEVLNQGDATISFNSPARKEGEKAAQFSSESMTNYAILSLPDNNKLDIGTSDFTVSFWVKAPTISNTQCIYHHGEGPGYNTGDPVKQSWFRFQSTSPFVRFIIEYKGSSGNWTEYTEKNMMDGQWHHYVCIHNAGSTYMYIDGELKSSALNKPLKAISASPYYIGANHRMRSGAVQFENFYRGALDTYILYNRALSDTEAKELYNNLK